MLVQCYSALNIDPFTTVRNADPNSNDFMEIR